MHNINALSFLFPFALSAIPARSFITPAGGSDRPFFFSFLYELFQLAALTGISFFSFFFSLSAIQAGGSDRPIFFRFFVFSFFLFFISYSSWRL